MRKLAKDENRLILQPIGIIHTDMKLKFDAPHQPQKDYDSSGLIELTPNNEEEKKRYLNALNDLKEFSHIWIVWWFHKNKNWRPMVRPPRGVEKRRGVFATRSPYRPNPIGITAVQLIKIEKLNIYVGTNDLLDKTPILDIKPYLISVDCIPQATLGWVSSIEESTVGQENYQINTSKLAKEQIEWLKDRGINFIEIARKKLAQDPTPHRTRRITVHNCNQYRMGCGAWRLYFTLEGMQVLIERLAPGYPDRLLYSDLHDQVPDRMAQIDFSKIWPG